MIGVVTSLLGWARGTVRVLALPVLIIVLVPGTAFAADPATHQYSSNLTQVCVDGEIVTTTSGDTGAGGSAGGALSEVCGGGTVPVGGGGGVGDVGGAGSAGSGPIGDLPFTGLDLGLLAAVAAALVVAGLLLQRRRRPGAMEA